MSGAYRHIGEHEKEIPESKEKRIYAKTNRRETRIRQETSLLCGFVREERFAQAFLFLLAEVGKQNPSLQTVDILCGLHLFGNFPADREGCLRFLQFCDDLAFLLGQNIHGRYGDADGIGRGRVIFGQRDRGFCVGICFEGGVLSVSLDRDGHIARLRGKQFIGGVAGDDIREADSQPAVGREDASVTLGADCHGLRARLRVVGCPDDRQALGTVLAILIQAESAVPVPNGRFQRVRVAAGVSRVARADHNRPCFGENGDAVGRAVCDKFFSAFADAVDVPREEVCPDSLRQPDGRFTQPVFAAVLGDRCDQKLLTEAVFVRVTVAFPAFGVLVVERLAERKPLGCGAVIAGIEIGNHAVAQAQGVGGKLTDSVFVCPWLFGEHGGVGAMHPVDGIEHAELQEAQVKLVIFFPEVMPADIVTPPTVAAVCGGCGEIGHQAQGCPRNGGVTRETDGVAVRADARIAGHNQRVAVARGMVEVMEMVERPERIQSVLGGGSALLPVDPPEVHAVLLEGMMQDAEVSLQKTLGGHVKGNDRFGLGVCAHRFRHGGVSVLVIADARGGVQVQRDAQAAPMQCL